MKRENYIIMMIVAIGGMVFVPVAPCRAYWTYLGSDVSGGSPDNYSESEDGYEYEWSWSYDVTGISRDGDSGGSWASAFMTADAEVDVWSFNGSSVSKSASTGPSVYGYSGYEDLLNPIYDPEDLEYSYDVIASGTVTVTGSVDDGDLASGDSVNSSAASGGSASGYEYGYGYVNGSVSKNSTGSTNIIVGGEATEDS